MYVLVCTIEEREGEGVRVYDWEDDGDIWSSVEEADTDSIVL